MVNIRFHCFFALALILVLPGLAMAQIDQVPNEDSEFSFEMNHKTVNQLKQKHRVYKSTGNSQAISISLPTDKGLSHFAVRPHDIRHPDYEQAVNGVVQSEYRMPEVLLFEGESSDGEFVRFSIINDRSRSSLRGLYSGDGEIFSLDANNDVGDDADVKVKKVDRAELLKVISACGTGGDHQHAAQTLPSIFGDDPEVAFLQAPPTASMTFRELQVATDADFEYHTTITGGGSTANAEILAILNSVDAIYRTDLGITISVTFQNVHTTAADPYTSSDSGILLDQFRAHWNANFSAGQNYDVAHLFTGRDLDDSVAGVAFLSATCGSFRYGLSQHFNSASLMTPLVAHEIGHNLGSDHDNCNGGEDFIMCPFLSASATSFSTGSQSQVSSLLASSTANCIGTTDDGGGGGGGGGGGEDPPPPPPDNDPPVLDPIGGQAVNEGGTLNFSISGSDPEGGAVTFSAANLPAGASLNGQSFTFTPGFDYVVGSATTRNANITFTITDDTGQTDSEVVTVVVTNVNNGLTINPISNVIARVDEVLKLQFYAVDPDGDGVTFSSANLPAGAQLTDNGTFSWKPTDPQQGVHSITIDAADWHGATDNEGFDITVLASSGGSLPPPLPGEGDSEDFDGDGIINSADTDDDNDGVLDTQEELDGSNMYDASSLLFNLETTFCTDWNGFINQQFNIAELNNFTTGQLNVDNTLFTLTGEARGSVTLPVLGNTQSDLLVHDLDGWETNSFGKVCGTLPGGSDAGDLDGRMLHYKPDASGGFDYVLNFPLSNPQTGRLFVQYNTFHPSLDITEADFLAVNFLTVTNEEVTQQTGTIIVYAADGSVRTSAPIVIAADGRVDFSIHDVGADGFDQIGLVEWRPDDDAAQFRVTLNRYAYDGPTPFDDVVEAVSLPATKGSKQTSIVPVDTRGMTSILELSNTGDVISNINIFVNDQAGNVVLNTFTSLNPGATQHFVLDGFLTADLGLARITSSAGSEIIVNALQYGRTATAGVRTLYHIQARESLGSVIQGTYNTFLSQDCFLLLGNTSSSDQDVFIDMTRTDGRRVINAQSETVPADGIFELDLCSIDVDDTFGVVRVTPTNPNTIVGTVVRIGESDSYRISTSVR